MLKHAILAVAAVLLLAGPLRAEDCPVQTGGENRLDAIAEAIRKAPTCKRSYEIMDACAYGASGDVALGAALHEKCEPLFLGRLSAAQRQAYTGEQRRCADKYARQSGTMYRSAAAFCQAKSTATYTAKFGGGK